MNFVPLTNDEQLAEARSRFPLLYDACLPRFPATANEDPVRYAVVCDQHTVSLSLT